MLVEKRTAFLRIFVTFVSLCLLSGAVMFIGMPVKGVGRVLAASRHVYDESGLLTEEEQQNLEEKLQAFADETGMELGFVSTDDLEGKTAREYADDFYDNNDFGLDEEYSGALLLVDMENRELYISTCGKMIDYLTDQRIEWVLDEVMDGLDDGFYQAAVNFADACAGYVEAGYEDNAYRYDEETGEVIPLEAAKKKMSPVWAVVIALIGAAAVGGLRYLIVSVRYKKYGEPEPYHYAGNSTVDFRREENRLVNKFVTRRHLPPPPPPTRSSGGSSAGRSTVHHSSGGRSHGGGGRRF